MAAEFRAIRTEDEVRLAILGKLKEKRTRDNSRTGDLMKRAKKTRRERIEAAAQSVLSLANLSLGDVTRVFEIIYTFFKVIVLWIWDWISYPVRVVSKGKLLSGVYEPGEGPSFARRLRIAFQDLGSTFIKLGQILSMMFMLPWSWVSEFSKLCDYLPPEDLDTVKKTIRDELGVPAEDVFDHISPEPIGAASLAQVHFVTLKDGREAVVKIQRPDLDERIRKDVLIIRPIAWMLEFMLKPLRRFIKPLEGIYPVEIINDFESGTIIEELDFLLEASFQQIYRNSLDYWGLTSQLHVPTVYWEYTTKRLLCMERIWFYFKLVDLDIGKMKRTYETVKFLRSIGYDMSANIKKLHRAWFYIMARHGLATMDVHHGNFLYQYDDSYAMVDFGIFFYSGSPSKAGEIARVAITRMLKGVTTRNWGGLMRVGAYVAGGGDEKKGPKWTGMSNDDRKGLLKTVTEAAEPMTKMSQGEGRKGLLIELGGMFRGGDMNKMMRENIRNFVPMMSRFTKMGDMSQVSGMIYQSMNAMRTVMYFGTWFAALDPSWDMFKEREWFYGYLWDKDGQIPMKRTGELARPILPKSDLFERERTIEEMKADDALIARARCEERYHTP
ncbi:MAG: AarF/UbiB family protein [Halobacteriota archaeon]|nr:AarF/UbiB family protein [Halobacteriota archaeon]